MSELAKALIKFHAELPDVGKGSVNPAFKSRYADLADITKAVLPKLAEQGLSWTTTPTMTEHGFVLAYKLTHTSGEAVEGAWPLPDPSKSTPQQLGSAVTYGRRYSLSAVTGISPDDDDDGNAASAKGAPRAVKADPSKDRITRAEAAVRAATDRASLDKVWDDVRRSGLDGIAGLKAAHAEMDAKFPASTVDAWATKEVAP